LWPNNHDLIDGEKVCYRRIRKDVSNQRRRHFGEKPVIPNGFDDGSVANPSARSFNCLREKSFSLFAARRIAVVPELDLEGNRRLRLVCEALLPIADHIGRQAVLRSPPADVIEVVEDIAPGGPSASEGFSTLVAPPEAEQLFQCCLIPDGEVEAARNGAVRTILDKKIFIWLGLNFFFAEEFKAADCAECAIEIGDRAGHLEDESALWNDRGRIILRLGHELGA